MKRCPKCEADYADDSLVFCLQDRASLIPAPTPKQAADTLIIPDRSTIRSKSRLLLLILLIAISLAAFLVIYKSQIASSPPQDRSYELKDPPYEIKKYAEITWNQLINDASKRVWAIGTKLSPFERSQVSSLIKKIQRQQISDVKFVLMNPDSSQLIKRIDDELKERIKDEQLRKKKISDVQNEIKSKLSWIDGYVSELKGNEKDKITVKCSEVYPTIGVVIIDDDLYAYSYPFGDTAADTVVIIFRKYADNPETKDLAAFFENHLNSIVHDAGERANGKCEKKPIQKSD